MVCPVCGSKMKVVNSKNDKNITIRIYSCNRCKSRFISSEILSELKIKKKTTSQYSVLVISNNSVNRDAVSLMSKYLPDFVKVFVRENSKNMSGSFKYNLYIYINEVNIPTIPFKNRVYIQSNKTILNTIYDIVINRLKKIGVVVNRRPKENIKIDVSEDGYIKR